MSRLPHTPESLIGPLIGFGHVYHTRLRPRQHRFVYPSFNVWLPMRALQQQPQNAGALALNRAGLLSFWDEDHGDGRSPAQGGALAWLDEVLQSQRITDADGEIWLQLLSATFQSLGSYESGLFCLQVIQPSDTSQ